MIKLSLGRMEKRASTISFIPSFLLKVKLIFQELLLSSSFLILLKYASSNNFNASPRNLPDTSFLE